MAYRKSRGYFFPIYNDNVTHDNNDYGSIFVSYVTERPPIFESFEEICDNIEKEWSESSNDRYISLINHLSVKLMVLEYYICVSLDHNQTMFFELRNAFNGMEKNYNDYKKWYEYVKMRMEKYDEKNK